MLTRVHCHPHLESLSDPLTLDTATSGYLWQHTHINKDCIVEAVIILSTVDSAGEITKYKLDELGSRFVTS